MNSKIPTMITNRRLLMPLTKKNTRQAYTVLLLLLLAFISSCQKLSFINENQNDATTTIPELLLPKVQWTAFLDSTGNDALYALRMLVQTDGENAGQIYNWQRGSFLAYEKLRNVQKMEEIADQLGQKEYSALAKFFKAHYFYQLTLTFGDIPFSEALKGETDSIYAPRYDSQEKVFQGILVLLKDADMLLQENTKPINGDIIFQGDLFKWRRLINAYRLKVLLSLSAKTTNETLQIIPEFKAIAAAGQLMQSNADDAQLVFLNQLGNRYPSFNASRYGSGMYMDSTYIRRLQDRQDPRLFAVATQTRVAKEEGKAIDDFTAYEGGDPIKPYAQVNDKAIEGKLSKVLERYHQDPVNEPFVLMGYAEQQFILAEAAVRGWIPGDAKEYYTQGVLSSFAFYEAHAKGLAPFLTREKAELYLQNPLVAFSNALPEKDQLTKILMQKYLRSFHQGGWNAYFDYLRTGMPEFRTIQGTKTAYRWMYPNEEYNLNATHVAAAIQAQFSGSDQISNKTWWLK